MGHLELGGGNDVRGVGRWVGHAAYVPTTSRACAPVNGAASFRVTVT